jgi:hypothetical protein
MVKTTTQIRNIEFIGEHKNDSIVIGNYGDARLTARGNFNLSGIIFCRRSTVELNLSGAGTVTFTGSCKRLFVQGIDGDCVLNLSHLSCEVVRVEAGKGKSVIILGRTKKIELLNLYNDAVVKYEGKPLLVNYSLSGNAKIECWKTPAIAEVTTG